MKKIIFLLLFLPFYSCNDWLDVESEISVTYRVDRRQRQMCIRDSRTPV